MNEVERKQLKIEEVGGEIHFTEAMWGYLYAMAGPKIRHGDVLEANDHFLVRADDIYDDHWGELPAVSPGYASTYGRVRVHPDKVVQGMGPQEEALHAQVKKRGAGREDYYIAVSLSFYDRFVHSRDHLVSLGYPARVFVYGDLDDDTPVPRWELLEVMRKLGIRSHLGFWDLVTPWRGGAAGAPTWCHALKANTDSGPRWHCVAEAIKKKDIPDGWEFYAESGGPRAALYIPGREDGD